MSFLFAVAKKLRIASSICIGAALVACTGTDSAIRNGLPEVTQTGQQARVLTPNPKGEVIGNGNVRVSLLVPTSIPGGAAAVAKELRNGAAMAMTDFGQNRIQLVIKDTQGQAAPAQNAAGEAVAEGSSLILGPLFAANVSAASGTAQPANIPILAFSTDTSVARRGVYLFSYTPQADTSRMIRYAASIGRRSIAAILPMNPEGNLRERLVLQEAGRAGIAATIIKYQRSPQGIEKAVAEAVQTVASADSIYIPEGGPIPGLIMAGLKRNGANLTGKQILGAGTWESVKASDPALQGALYPGRDVSAFNGFATRYQGKFGARPGVQAALAYDAVTLASEMVRINGATNPYPQSALEANRGFKGVNGAFRIQSNGITQRGLAIYKIDGGQGRLLEPAVSSFSGS
jgi:ABC-type branched-subunit amino acid transport system substrate-binding protein